MKLCLSTLMWSDRPLAEALESARSTGVRALDLGATPACAHLILTDARAGVDAVKPLLDGWEVLALSADHADLPRAEEDGGLEAVEHVVSAMKAARMLGARVVSTSL